MNTRQGPRRQLGLTMIELVIVMTTVGVLLALAIPSYRYVTTANRIASEVNGLLGDLQYARAEAIREGQTVSACTSSNGTSCSTSPNWQSGWIVFADANGNGTVDAGETVLRIGNAFSSQDTFVDTVNSITGITFNREGFAQFPAGVTASSVITLHAATPSTSSTRCLMVSIIGLMVVQTAGTGTCS
jgi:type IV fimbrial biogenesis protein FimT